MLSQEQIKEMIDGAMKTSIKLQQVDPDILDELRMLNKKFLTQGQLDQLWIIEQREKLLIGSKELELCIKKENDNIKKRSGKKDFESGSQSLGLSPNSGQTKEKSNPKFVKLLP